MQTTQERTKCSVWCVLNARICVPVSVECECLLVNVILIVLVFGKIDGIGANFTNKPRQRARALLAARTH